MEHAKAGGPIPAAPDPDGGQQMEVVEGQACLNMEILAQTRPVRCSKSIASGPAPGCEPCGRHSTCDLQRPGPGAAAPHPRRTESAGDADAPAASPANPWEWTEASGASSKAAFR